MSNEARNILVIGDHTPLSHPTLAEGYKGLVNRDPVLHPVGYSAAIPPASIATYTLEEITQRALDMDKAKSRLSDIVLAGNDGAEIPSLDQNGQGFCWNYGPGGALIAVRAKLKLPYKRLSPHATACKQTGFRDEGGWGAKALEFMAANGIPDVDHWKEKSMSKSYDTPETWANAKLYMPDVQFADLASPNYNRDLSWLQRLTNLVNRNPTVDDYDWWGHCVHALDVVVGAAQRAFSRDESGKMLSVTAFDLMWGMNDSVTGGLGIRFRNSWADTYGDRGLAVLTGMKAQANNSVAIVSAIA